MLIENVWEDRVKILSWAEKLAQGEGVYSVCSPSHVQELVAHWMASGSLDYPLGRVAERSARGFRLSQEIQSPHGTSPEFGTFQELGELAVDRDSLHRLFLENPDSLGPILDALMSALYRSSGGDLAGFSLAMDDSNGSSFVQMQGGRAV